LLRWAIETRVPDHQHRKGLGQAIDEYIAAREKVASREVLKARKVVRPPAPPPPPQPEYKLLDLGPELQLVDWGPLTLPFKLDPEIAKIAKRRNGESVEDMVKRLTTELAKRGRGQIATSPK
jgi:hypothetical protein